MESSYHSYRLYFWLSVLALLFLYIKLPLYISILDTALLIFFIICCILFFLLPNELSFVTWILKQEEYIKSTNGKFSNSAFTTITDTFFSWIPNREQSNNGIVVPPPCPSSVITNQNEKPGLFTTKTSWLNSMLTSDMYHLEYTKAHFFIFIIYYIPNYKLYVIGFMKKYFWAHQYEKLWNAIQAPNVKYLMETIGKSKISMKFTKEEIQEYDEKQKVFRENNVIYKLVNQVILKMNNTATKTSITTVVTKEKTVEKKISEMAKGLSTKKIFEAAIKATDDIIENTKHHHYPIQKCIEKAKGYEASKNYLKSSKWYFRAADSVKDSKDKFNYQSDGITSLLNVSNFTSSTTLLLNDEVLKKLTNAGEQYAVDKSGFSSIAKTYEAIGDQIIQSVKKQQKERKNKGPKKSIFKKLSEAATTKLEEHLGGASQNDQEEIVGMEILQYTATDIKYFEIGANVLELASEYYEKSMNSPFKKQSCALQASAAYGLCGKYNRTIEMLSNVCNETYQEVMKGKPGENLRLREQCLHLGLAKMIQTSQLKELQFISNLKEILPEKYHEYCMEVLAFIDQILMLWQKQKIEQIKETLKRYDDQHHVLYDYEIQSILSACETMEYVDVKN